jgi:hypothetical protein
MVVECHSCNNVGLLSGRFLLSLAPYTQLKGLGGHIDQGWGKEVA